MSGNYDFTSRVEFKEEDVLPLETIREHTKTDDTPTVTDNVLEIYRSVAFEQAQKYTGRIILGSAAVMDRFEIDASKETWGRPKKSYRVDLSFLPIERTVLVGKQRVYVKNNSRKLDVRSDFLTVNMGNCCAGRGMFYDGHVLYTTGYLNKEDIPSTIIYGCLKFITWAVFNPGDELLTVRNRLGTTETGLIGTNNGAWASGAIEHWKGYKVN